MKTQTMKALTFKRYGKSPEIGFADVPRPTLKADELLVQVHAASVNPIDNMIPTGIFKAVVKFQLPATLGSDLAGVVTEVGSRRDPLQAGRCGLRQHLRPGHGLDRRVRGGARERRRAEAGQPGLRAGGIDPDGRADLVAGAEGARQSSGRAEGVHSGRLRRHRHVRDPVGQAPWRQGGNDHQHGQCRTGAQPGRRRGGRLQEAGVRDGAARLRRGAGHRQG